jgi:hypothetical protein
MNPETSLALPATAELMRQATDVAGVCRDIVSKTALSIQGRKYVRVEGWMSIATAHGCMASAGPVERIDGGYRCMASINRIRDSVVLCTGEGFVGEDEATWFGGVSPGGKNLPKRPDYAIRAMCQTRAISRACRTAFAHVVVLMDSGLSTTPAEEVPDGGFDNNAQPPTATPAPEPRRVTPTQAPAAVAVPRDPQPAGDDSWRMVVVPPFIKKYAGQTLGDMADKDLQWWAQNYEPKPWKGRISDKDLDLKAALMEGLKSITPGGAATSPGRVQPSDEELANVDNNSSDVPF